MPPADVNLGFHILEAASGNVRACTIIFETLATECLPALVRRPQLLSSQLTAEKTCR